MAAWSVEWCQFAGDSIAEAHQGGAGRDRGNGGGTSIRELAVGAGVGAFRAKKACAKGLSRSRAR